MHTITVSAPSNLDATIEELAKLLADQSKAVSINGQGWGINVEPVGDYLFTVTHYPPDDDWLIDSHQGMLVHSRIPLEDVLGGVRLIIADEGYTR